MNNCKLSEGETTNAIRALYVVPIPENNISLDSRCDTATLVRSNDAAIMSDNLGMPEISKSSKKLHAPRNRDGLDCFPKLKEKQKRIESSDKGEKSTVVLHLDSIIIHFIIKGHHFLRTNYGKRSDASKTEDQWC